MGAAGPLDLDLSTLRHAHTGMGLRRGCRKPGGDAAGQGEVTALYPPPCVQAWACVEAAANQAMMLLGKARSQLSALQSLGDCRIRWSGGCVCVCWGGEVGGAQWPQLSALQSLGDCRIRCSGGSGRVGGHRHSRSLSVSFWPRNSSTVYPYPRIMHPYQSSLLTLHLRAPPAGQPSSSCRLQQSVKVAQQGSGRAPLTAMDLHLLANPRLLDTHMQVGVGVVVVVVASVGEYGEMSARLSCILASACSVHKLRHACRGASPPFLLLTVVANLAPHVQAIEAATRAVSEQQELAGSARLLYSWLQVWSVEPVVLHSCPSFSPAIMYNWRIPLSPQPPSPRHATGLHHDTENGLHTIYCCPRECTCMARVPSFGSQSVIAEEARARGIDGWSAKAASASSLMEGGGATGGSAEAASSGMLQSLRQLPECDGSAATRLLEHLDHQLQRAVEVAGPRLGGMRTGERHEGGGAGPRLEGMRPGERHKGGHSRWAREWARRVEHHDPVPEERLGHRLTVSRLLAAERLSVYSPSSGAGRAAAAPDMTMQHFQRLAEQVSGWQAGL